MSNSSHQGNDTLQVKKLRRYAWWNVAAGFSVIFFVLAVPAILMPTMYSAIMADFGWSRGVVTSFSSVKFSSGAITALIMAYTVDRVGLKRMILGAGVALGLAMFSLPFVNNLISYYLVAAVFGATAIIAAVGIKILISRWFSARIGLAAGIAFVGGGVAGAITPVLAHWLIAQYGWQTTGAIMGFGIWVFMIPFFLFSARETPADYGGEPEIYDARNNNSVQHVLNDDPHDEAKPVMKMPLFWTIVFAHVLIGAVDHSVMEHTPLFLEKDAKLGAGVAALGFSIVMIASTVGKIGFGWVYDKFSMKGVAMCWASLALGISLAFSVSGTLTLAAFLIMRGLSHGGVLIDVAILARHNFSKANLTKTVSKFTAANMVGGAVGPGLVGFSHDKTGNYTASFVTLIILALIAAFIVFNIRPKYWRPNS